MDFEGFGCENHISPCYLFASNNFIGLPHFNDEGEPVDNEQISRFTNFILSLDSDDNISLETYLEEGGNLLDSYEYYQYGNGEYIIVTIQEIIISLGSVKLMREMISIEPEYINMVVNNHSLLSHSIIYDVNEITDLLLTHGADPNIQGKRGKTALYHAINSNDSELVKKLLDNGADPNMRYALPRFNYLYTAIHYNSYARRKEQIKNNKKIIKMLIKSGAKFENKSHFKEKCIYDEIIAEMNETGEY